MLKQIGDANWSQAEAAEYQSIFDLFQRALMGFQNVRLIQNIEETCVKCQNACVGGGFGGLGG